MIAQIEQSAQELVRCETLNGFGRIGPYRQEVHDGGGEQGGENGAVAELVAKGKERNDEQRHVEHVAEGADLDAGEEVVEDDTGAVDSAGDNVVGVDEKDESYRHDAASCHNKEDVAPHFARGEGLCDLMQCF